MAHPIVGNGFSSFGVDGVNARRTYRAKQNGIQLGVLGKIADHVGVNVQRVMKIRHVVMILSRPDKTPVGRIAAASGKNILTPVSGHIPKSKGVQMAV